MPSIRCPTNRRTQPPTKHDTPQRHFSSTRRIIPAKISGSQRHGAAYSKANHVRDRTEPCSAAIWALRTSCTGSCRTSRDMVGTSTADSNFILNCSACLEGQHPRRTSAAGSRVFRFFCLHLRSACGNSACCRTASEILRPVTSNAVCPVRGPLLRYAATAAAPAGSAKKSLLPAKSSDGVEHFFLFDQQHLVHHLADARHIAFVGRACRQSIGASVARVGLHRLALLPRQIIGGARSACTPTTLTEGARCFNAAPMPRISAVSPIGTITWSSRATARGVPWRSWQGPRRSGSVASFKK